MNRGGRGEDDLATFKRPPDDDILGSKV